MWKLTLINAERIIRDATTDAWATAMVAMRLWMSTTLVKAMVRGGLGMQGLAQTKFYQFITSNAGLSQLGIDRSEPPKLLDAYEESFSAIVAGTSVVMLFGDEDLIKIRTAHPATGTGHLQVESWMDWVFDGETVGRGFVPRGKLPKGADANVRLASPLGGLMLPQGVLGSTGNWSFPSDLMDFDSKWFVANLPIIELVVAKQAQIFLSESFK